MLNATPWIRDDFLKILASKTPGMTPYTDDEGVDGEKGVARGMEGTAGMGDREANGEGNGGGNGNGGGRVGREEGGHRVEEDGGREGGSSIMQEYK